jgi:hypothetical protein
MLSTGPLRAPSRRTTQTNQNDVDKLLCTEQVLVTRFDRFRDFFVANHG